VEMYFLDIMDCWTGEKIKIKEDFRETEEIEK
jgi:hypothetical protein